MPEWSDEQRESVAAQFRRVGGGDWFESNGLADPRGPLWRECLGCHRLRTIEEVADAAPGGDGAATWRCRRCGWAGAPESLFKYQTDLLLNLTESPDCPPIVREVLAECGHLLYRISRGQRDAIAEAGDAARHAVRILEHYADYEEWLRVASRGSGDARVLQGRPPAGGRPPRRRPRRRETGAATAEAAMPRPHCALADTCGGKPPPGRAAALAGSHGLQRSGAG